jgi:ribonuclease E
LHEDENMPVNMPVMAQPVSAVPTSALPVPIVPEPETEQDKQQTVQVPAHEPIKELATVSPPASITTMREPSPDEIEIESGKTNDETAAAEIEVTAPVSEREETRLPQRSDVIEPLNLVASGLIMIETQPEKIKTAEAEAATESALPQRRRKRTPPPPVVNQDEPLVQVETHK